MTNNLTNMKAAAITRCPVTLARNPSYPLASRRRLWLPAAAMLLIAAAPASHAEAGNPLTPEQQDAKLRRVATIARRVWPD